MSNFWIDFDDFLNYNLPKEIIKHGTQNQDISADTSIGRSMEELSANMINSTAVIRIDIAKCIGRYYK